MSDQVPLIKGKRVDCSGPCVVMAGGGETLDRIFFLNVDGYDAAPSSPPVHHMIIEARKVDRAPPSPCAGGAPAGTVVVKGREVTVLDCPPRTPEVDRQIMHGEGAHVEHVLGYWDENGIRYVVSVHGATDSNKSLLAQVIASIEIVERSAEGANPIALREGGAVVPAEPFVRELSAVNGRSNHRREIEW